MPTNENSSSDRRSFIGKGSLVALTAALASSSASAQEQANLSSLQEKLRTDSELRNRFAQDPGSILSANGIKLNADQIANLKKQLDAAKIGQTGNPQAVSVGITVGN